VSSVPKETSDGFDQRHSIASILAPLQIPPEEAAVIRARQIADISRLGILMVLTNLLSTALAMILFWTGPLSQIVGLWGTAMCLACALYFIKALDALDRPQPELRSQRSLLRYARSSFFFGVLWGVFPVLVLGQAGVFAQMGVVTLLLAMIFGASFVLARLPQAAFAFTVPAATGLVIGLQFLPDFRNDYLALVVVVYSTVVAICVRWNYNQFVAQHLSGAAVREQNDLIGLLLRDFEESTSDWLWQTDVDGRLQALPLTVEGGKTGYALMSEGERLTSLFTKGDARNVLVSSMTRRQGFRDLVLEVSSADEASQWWSITGKPIFDGETFSGFRGVASDVTESKQIEDRIAFLAHYDGLTGLPNRASFQECLEKACRTKPARGQVRAILWMDLDNFKWVNDTLGHPAGDELLRQFASRLNEVCAPRDMIARLGGDEFAIHVERRGRTSLTQFLDCMVERLSDPYEIWGSTVNCSASLGVRWINEGTDVPQDVLTHADLALYQAKKRGKGVWHEFTQDLDDHARARRVIEADLHHALRENQLSTRFQPIVDARTGELVSCETLLRWEHPQRGLIMPGEFIQHAEDCGLIARMGDWVIRDALAQARRLPETVGVSVNISPLQLHSASLLTTIINALATNGIDPARLDLEITESILLSDTDFVLERLGQLKEIGLKLSLDDFGTGFSSLSYLRSFPFDKIKIDKCFVSDLETNEDSRAITKATIGLAQSLGLRCTAEGVESEAQWRFLSRNGCDEIQGFLISRAREMSDLAGLVTLSEPDRSSEPVRAVAHLEPTAARAAKDVPGGDASADGARQSEG